MTGYWEVAQSLSVVMFSFAAFLTLFWLRKRDRRKDLALALLFAVMGLYDHSVSKVYSAGGPAESLPWLRLLSAADDAGAPIFLWYLSTYTGMVRAHVLKTVAAIFGVFALAELLAPGDLALIAASPLTFTVRLPLLPPLEYSVVKAGPLAMIAALAGIVFASYCLFTIHRYAVSGHRREAKGFYAMIVVVMAAIVNDTLVGSGVYRFLFLTEYAWACVLVFLAYRSSEEILMGAEAARMLDKSEAQLRAMVEHVPFNIWMCDTDGRLILQNAADIATVGDHVGETYEQWTKPGGEPSQFALFSRRALSGEVVDERVSYVVGDETRTYRDIIAPARSAGGLIGSVGIGIDVTDQVRAEGELKARLAEKEVLLRELHHRVKNNLQIIASLMNIRAETLTDEATKEAFFAIERQVHAIARVHASLHLSDNLATIDFGDYLDDLAHELRSLHNAANIEIAMEVEHLLMGIESAMPCSLIANELLVNCFKHSFRNRATGRLVVCLKRVDDDAALLAVEDDGPGIPRGATAPEKSAVGLILVASLAAQIGGTLSVVEPARNRVEVRFPWSEAPVQR